MTGSSLGSFAQFLTVIFIFILVLVLAWFSTRLVARYQSTGGVSHGNIEIVEAFRLSQTQVIELIRLGDRYIALAVGKDHVEKLGEWKKDEIELEFKDDQAGSGQTSFASGFRAALDKYVGKKNSENQ